RFVPGAAERLAGAFADARVAQPWAPLAPELQVVLEHLIEDARARDAAPDGVRELAVPDDVDALLREALYDHLDRKLSEAFRRDDGEVARRKRTSALMGLRALCTD